MGSSGAILDLSKLNDLREKASPSEEKALGDRSLGELLSGLEYELAARHAEAYECDTIARLLAEARKRTGD